MNTVDKQHFCDVWISLLSHLVKQPASISPRGQTCREITNAHLVIRDAHNNIFVQETRNLNYRFMVAEWLWIWFGRDDVKTISRYNPHIAGFSDNGVDFNGAYGIPVVAQWPRVVKLLQDDSDTRQAVIQIYRPPTGPTLDVPCTLSLQFLLRDGALSVIANMRSSDVWLGLPYDAFNFSMLGNILAGILCVKLGSLCFNLGSSHLYNRDFAKATQILESRGGGITSVSSPQLPGPPPAWLEYVLTDGASLGLNDRVWGMYGDALRAKKSAEALLELSSWALR